MYGGTNQYDRADFSPSAGSPKYSDNNALNASMVSANNQQ